MKVSIIGNDLAVSMLGGPKGRERLHLRNEYPKNKLSIALFQQFALLHLIAPYLPDEINANFPIYPEVKKLVNSLYRSENKKNPHLNLPVRAAIKYINKSDPRKVVIAYSGGKDSLWNLWWADKNFGKKSVLAVHIKGINRYVSSFEWQYTLRQQESIGFNLRKIDLLNSSRNRGRSIRRSRDIFISAMLLPLALEHNASKILIEGNMSESSPFACKPSTWIAINSLFKKLGTSTQVCWIDHGNTGAIKDILSERPDWLPLVYDCVSSPVWKPSLRKKWGKIAPSFPLYESQCGSCVKCRILNMARVSYDTRLLTTTSEKDIKVFIENTKDWIYKWRHELRQFLDDSFYEEQEIILRKYNITPLPGFDK